MTTVSVTRTSDTPIQWSSANFDWSSTDSGEPWSDQNITTFALDVGETVGITEALAKSSIPGIAEAFSLSESVSWGALAALSEFVQFSELYEDEIAFYLGFTEFVSFSEALANATSTPFSENFSVADSHVSGVGVGSEESIVFGEAFDRVSSFFKVFSETVGFEESLGHLYVLNALETITLFDSLLRNCNSVIADIAVLTGEVSFAEFSSEVLLDTPLGNAPWKVFTPGDYEFEKALIGVFLTRQSDAYDVRVKKAIVSTDVPDIVETGSADVSSTGWTTVTFTRSFHVVEEVVTTLMSGGALAIPEIRQGYTTNTSFQVRLMRSDSPATQVAGRISYSVKGY